MASKDLHSNIKALVAFNATTINSNTTTQGIIIDTQGFESVEFFLRMNAWTSGNATLALVEGDLPDLSDGQSVDPNFIIELLSNTKLNAANTVSNIGYVGKKRYVRGDVVSAGGANFNASAIAVLGHPHKAPTDTTTPPLG